MPAVISIGHRANYATLCTAAIAGHTELRICTDPSGVERVVLCVLSTRDNKVQVVPFAVLLEAPQDYAVLGGPGQAMSQRDAMPHAMATPSATPSAAEGENVSNG